MRVNGKSQLFSFKFQGEPIEEEQVPSRPKNRGMRSPSPQPSLAGRGGHGNRASVLECGSPHRFGTLRKAAGRVALQGRSRAMPLSSGQAGSTRASRVDSGAPPESLECGGNTDRTSLGRGAQGGTRGRVRSPFLLPQGEGGRRPDEGELSGNSKRNCLA